MSVMRLKAWPSTVEEAQGLPVSDARSDAPAKAKKPKDPKPKKPKASKSGKAGGQAAKE